MEAALSTDAGSTRPKIRDLLSADELRGMAAGTGMSGEDVLKRLAPLSGMPEGAFQLAATAGEAIGRSMGIKAEKRAELALRAPYPVAARALVFALTGLRYTITSAFDIASGAYFEAELPADIFSLGGTLQIDVEDRGAQVLLIGATQVKGQRFDWGKGKRALDEVFAKTEGFARRLG